MSTEGMQELSAALANTLKLPNGREVQVKSISTARALQLIRAYGQLDEGKLFGTLTGMADVIESLGQELGIAEELQELEIDETMQVVQDFFVLLIQRMMKTKKMKIAEASTPTQPQPSSSPSTGGSPGTAAASPGSPSAG